MKRDVGVLFFRSHTLTLETQTMTLILTEELVDDDFNARFVGKSSVQSMWLWPSQFVGNAGQHPAIVVRNVHSGVVLFGVTRFHDAISMPNHTAAFHLRSPHDAAKLHDFCNQCFALPGSHSFVLMGGGDLETMAMHPSSIVSRARRILRERFDVVPEMANIGGSVDAAISHDGTVHYCRIPFVKEAIQRHSPAESTAIVWVVCVGTMLSAALLVWQMKNQH
jgi:hypothetical protein